MKVLKGFILLIGMVFLAGCTSEEDLTEARNRQCKVAYGDGYSFVVDTIKYDGDNWQNVIICGNGSGELKEIY